MRLTDIVALATWSPLRPPTPQGLAPYTIAPLWRASHCATRDWWPFFDILSVAALGHLPLASHARGRWPPALWKTQMACMRRFARGLEGLA
eukprot:1908101-Pyramimonas_sp.AAC.1